MYLLLNIKIVHIIVFIIRNVRRILKMWKNESVEKKLFQVEYLAAHSMPRSNFYYLGSAEFICATWFLFAQSDGTYRASRTRRKLYFFNRFSLR